MFTPEKLPFSHVFPADEDFDVKTFEATFYNGKKLNVMYLFDHKKTGAECVRININSVLPVFRGMVPPGIPQFTVIPQLFNFIKTLHFDDCSKCGGYPSCACRCRIPKEEEGMDLRCKEDHFHHYCWSHMMLWFQYYLERAIMLQESKKHYDERVTFVHGQVDGYWYSAGARATPEYWLEYARAGNYSAFN